MCLRGESVCVLEDRKCVCLRRERVFVWGKRKCVCVGEKEQEMKIM